MVENEPSSKSWKHLVLAGAGVIAGGFTVLFVLRHPLSHGLYLILGFFGLVWLSWGLRNLKLGLDSKHWPTIKGRVVAVELKEVSKMEFAAPATLRGYEPTVRYEYQISGKIFVAETVSLGQYLLKSRKEAQEILDRYPPGKPVRVHYNPRQPQIAVLEPHVFLDNLLSVAVGSFMLLIAYSIWVSVRASK